MQQAEKEKAVAQLQTIIGKLEQWQHKFARELDAAGSAGVAKSALIRLEDRIRN